MTRLVAYESRLELARVMLADFDQSVVGIASQPFQLTGFDEGMKRRHVPDLLLLHDSGAVTVVDVKPASRLSDPTVAAVFAWTERVLAAHGWDFEVWTGTDPVVLSNVRFLAGYRRHSVICEQLIPAVLELAATHTTIGDLEHALAAQATMSAAAGGYASTLVRPACS